MSDIFHPKWKSLSDCPKCGEFMTHGHECGAHGKPDSEPTMSKKYHDSLVRQLDGEAVERVQPIELDIPDRREYPDDPISQLSDDVLRESRIRKGREWLKEHGLLPNGERVQPSDSEPKPTTWGNSEYLEVLPEAVERVQPEPVPSTSVEPQVEPSEEDLIADAFAKAAANCHGGTIQTKIVGWTPTHENCDECNKLAPKLAADSVSHLPTVSRDCRHCGHNIVYSLSAGGWVHMPDETKQCFLGEGGPDAEPSVSHPPLEQELLESAQALIDYIHGEEIDSPKSGLELAFRNKLSGRTYRFENALAAFVRERSKP